MSKGRVLVLLGCLLCGMVPSLFAEILLETHFNGTVLITFPNGEITFVGTGEPIPPIPSQSLLEVLEGQATIKTGQGDTVKVSCLGHEGTVERGASVTLTCGTDSGLLKVLQGSLKWVNREGKQFNLLAGAEYPIQLGKPQVAPPTAAGEALGGPPLAGDLAREPAVDSRSIESSPAQ